MLQLKRFLKRFAGDRTQHFTIFIAIVSAHRATSCIISFTGSPHFNKHKKIDT